MGVGGGWGVPPTHVHMHACTCAHGKHDNFMQMAAPIGGIPGIPYDVIRACACVHVHVYAHVWEAPSHHPPPTSTHPQGGPPESVKIQ